MSDFELMNTPEKIQYLYENQDNIQDGNIWVKLLCVHDDPEDNEDDD